MIVILDYGLGNVGSILNIVRKAGGDAVVSSNRKDLEHASAIILPGVGSFDNAITKLDKLGLVTLLNELVQEKKIPFLGICLGMQLLLESSEEGKKKGFGWIEGRVMKFNMSKVNNKNLKIPHMGWNEIKYYGDSFFFKTSLRKERYYFVHSYHVECTNQENILATCNHGHEFACAINKENIYGVQFHPEKSHSFGVSFFRRFIEIVKC